MKAMKIVIAASCLFLIVSCAHDVKDRTANSEVHNSFYDTLLFISPCRTKTKLSETKVAPRLGEDLAASLAASAAEVVIDWIGLALEQAAEDDIDITTVSSNLVSLSQITNTNNVCLQVIRGEFACAEDNTNSYTNEFSVKPKSLVLAPLKVVEDTEELFIELLPIIHGNAVSFTPLEVRYSGYTPRDPRVKKPRDLALRIGYALPDQDASFGQHTASRLINFGTLKPDDGKQATIKYVTEDGRLTLVNQTQWITMLPETEGQPITFAANIIETRKANQLSKFLSEVFNASKDEMKQKVSAAIAELEMFKTSNELKNEKLVLEKSKLDNKKVYFDAIVLVQTQEEALEKLCDPKAQTPISAIMAAQTQLYYSKKHANLIAAELGIKQPYPDESIKPTDGKCDDH